MKGQMAIFVIIILIVALGASLLIWKYTSDNDTLNITPSDTAAYEDYIRSCVAEHYGSLVDRLALQAGKPNIEASAIQAEEGHINYGYLDRDVLPSEQELEHTLEELARIALDNCTGEPFRGYTITGGTIEGITLDANTITLYYAEGTLLAKDNLEHRISAFNIKVDKPIKAALIESHELVKTINTGYLDLALLQSTDFTVQTVAYDPSTIILDVKGQDITFVFAAKLVINTPPRINNLPAVYEGRVGEPITIILNVTDDEMDTLTFADTTPLFDIRQGAISFTPEIRGTYDTIISVNDGHTTTEKNIQFLIR